MLLIGGSLRSDVLPLGDLGQGMQAHFGLASLPDAQNMRQRARPWQPYRSVASWYTWRLIDG